MVVSVMFVSCGDNNNSGNPTPSGTNDEFDGPGTDEDFDSTDDDPDDTDFDSTDDETDKITSNTFLPASGNVYFLYAVKVRENPKSAKKNYVGSVNFASSAELIEKNDTWSKIKFVSEGGAKIEGYVYNDVYTMDANEVTMDWYTEAKDAKIGNLGKRADGTPYTLKIRTTPWNCGSALFDSDSEYLDVNVLPNIIGGKYSVTDGKDIKVLGATKDGSWFYVQYTATVDGAEKTEKGFCYKTYVVIAGAETPDATEDANQPPVINPLPV